MLEDRTIMPSRICNNELNYRNKSVLVLNDIRIKKDVHWCNLEYAHKMNCFQELYNWISRGLYRNRYSHNYIDSETRTQTKVEVASIALYQEIHRGITIVFIKVSYNAKNYIKNLLARNDLVSFFRATSKSKMLYSKTTSKREAMFDVDRISAYAEPILKLARALYDGDIYFHAYKGLKVNYYSLNPKDLYDSLQTARYATSDPSLELEDIDIEENTLHEDISPQYSAINGHNGLILTFCILRGIHGYVPDMGKTFIIPNITKGQKLEMIPQDDGDDYFDMCIFLADVVEHGSSSWNRKHPKVAEQFQKVKDGIQTGIINDEPWQPARMSITIPIYFETNNPKQLWYDIQSKLHL